MNREILAPWELAADWVRICDSFNLSQAEFFCRSGLEVESMLGQVMQRAAANGSWTEHFRKCLRFSTRIPYMIRIFTINAPLIWQIASSAHIQVSMHFYTSRVSSSTQVINKLWWFSFKGTHIRSATSFCFLNMQWGDSLADFVMSKAGIQVLCPNENSIQFWCKLYVRDVKFSDTGYKLL